MTIKENYKSASVADRNAWDRNESVIQHFQIRHLASRLRSTTEREDTRTDVRLILTARSKRYRGG